MNSFLAKHNPTQAKAIRAFLKGRRSGPISSMEPGPDLNCLKNAQYRDNAGNAVTIHPVNVDIPENQILSVDPIDQALMGESSTNVDITIGNNYTFIRVPTVVLHAKDMLEGHGGLALLTATSKPIPLYDHLLELLELAGNGFDMPAMISFHDFVFPDTALGMKIRFSLLLARSDWLASHPNLDAETPGDQALSLLLHPAALSQPEIQQFLEFRYIPIELLPSS